MRIALTPPLDSGLEPVVFVDGSPQNRFATLHDPFEVTLARNSTDGWYTAAEVRESPTDRPQADGAYWPSRMTLKPRVVTIRGRVVQHDGSSSLELALLNDRLNAMVGQRLTLQVEDALGRRQSDCYLSSQMSWSSDLGVTDVTLIVTCPDPLKYGPEQSFQASSSTCLVVNGGNAPTWPRVRIGGPVKTLKIRPSAAGADGLVVWQGDEKDGLDLDFRDMVPSRGTVTDDHAFPIPPGTQRLTVEAGNIDAKAVVLLRPAWK